MSSGSGTRSSMVMPWRMSASHFISLIEAKRWMRVMPSQCIAIDERVPLPDDMIPPDARVEIEAKLAAGYFAGERPRGDYAGTVGRDLNE